MGNRFYYHIPWIAWLTTLLVLSFLPGNQLPKIKWDWISIDTAVHVILYLVLALLFLVGFMSPEAKKRKRLNLSDFRLYGGLILVGIFIGYFVELIQGNFISGRYFDWTDIFANTIGTIFGTFLYALIGRKLI